MNGNPVAVEGEGMLARCFQHETDHLDGILYTDRLEGEDRKAALRVHPERQLRRRHGTHHGQARQDGRVQLRCRLLRAGRQLGAATA